MRVSRREEKGRECKNILVGFLYVESGGTKVMSDNHKEQGTRINTMIASTSKLGPN